MAFGSADPVAEFDWRLWSCTTCACGGMLIEMREIYEAMLATAAVSCVQPMEKPQKHCCSSGRSIKATAAASGIQNGLKRSFLASSIELILC